MIEQFINEVKMELEVKGLNDITEDELVRYVYIKLGQNFNFDLRFYFGNNKTRIQMYQESKSKSREEKMKRRTGICIDIADVLEYILKKGFGINISTERDIDDNQSYPHVYNIVTNSKGISYRIDLQLDLKYIQSCSRTKHFGKSEFDEKKDVISYSTLEAIDRKIGYIDKERYSEDYIDMLRLDLDESDSFVDKARGAIENLEATPYADMGYVERFGYHRALLKRLFPIPKEASKFNFIECYYERDNNEKDYQFCIILSNVTNINEISVYMYSMEERKYIGMTLKEFAEKTEQGLKTIQKVPGLQKAINSLRKEKNGINGKNDSEAR